MTAEDFGFEPTDRVPPSMGKAIQLVHAIDNMAESGGIHPIDNARDLLGLFDTYRPWQWSTYGRLSGLGPLDLETIQLARSVYLFRHRRQKTR